MEIRKVGNRVLTHQGQILAFLKMTRWPLVDFLLCHLHNLRDSRKVVFRSVFNTKHGFNMGGLCFLQLTIISTRKFSFTRASTKLNSTSHVYKMLLLVIIKIIFKKKKSKSSKNNEKKLISEPLCLFVIVYICVVVFVFFLFFLTFNKNKRGFVPVNSQIEVFVHRSLPNQFSVKSRISTCRERRIK